MRAYLLLLCLALLQQEARSSPDPSDCSSPDAVRVAEEALQQINQDRTNGYIWGLNRLYDVFHSPDKEKGGVFYKLTIDVLETRCHIISRKPWKDCEVRSIGDIPVYGECEVSAHVDSEVKLQSYSCAIRQVPAIEVVGVCPDCPTADNLDEPIVKETANLSLQMFNKDSKLGNYFALESITRASSQWVVGPAYFVDFTIVETVCSKGTDPGELGSCPPMDCQFAHRGFCRGSHVTQEEMFEIRRPVGKKDSSFQNPVQVTCEIYEPKAATEEETVHAKADAEHTEYQHHNHTHLHPHEHTHSDTDSSSGATSKPPSSLGTVVEKPASPRSAPSARACPGPHRHRMGLDRLRL
ncbi:fetuin-B-like [Salarias fasciatus]|uniref:Fetuin-B-like n=1 Tax=Salarias fasciatus TaxID=181472 RepID=A0A672FAI7_SALFA|nr:fetuin-B-like [Salarias fasciatus]